VNGLGTVPAWPVAWTTIVVPEPGPDFGLVGAIGVQSVTRMTPGFCDYEMVLSPDLVGGDGPGAPDFAVNVLAVGDLAVPGIARIGYVGSFVGFGIQRTRIRIVAADLVTVLAEAAWQGVIRVSVFRKGPTMAFGP
jgi:hypothetical protein